MIDKNRYSHGEILAWVGNESQGSESLRDKPLRAYVFSARKDDYSLKIGDFSLDELDKFIQEVSESKLPHLETLYAVRKELAESTR